MSMVTVVIYLSSSTKSRKRINYEAEQVEKDPSSVVFFFFDSSVLLIMNF